MRKRSIKSLKKQAWKLLSLCIRLEAADANGLVSCVTCGTRKHWKEIQAGHYVPGRGNAILFDERGIAPQCSGCNIARRGNVSAYHSYMLRKYRDAHHVIDDLHFQARMPKRFNVSELKEMIESYKSRLQDIELKR